MLSWICSVASFFEGKKVATPVRIPLGIAGELKTIIAKNSNLTISAKSHIMLFLLLEVFDVL